MTTPDIIWHVASSCNPPGSGESGNDFKVPALDPGAGNCLVMSINYPNGSTPTVTDNNGNTWTSAASADAGSGNNVMNVFTAKNANAGDFIITVSFGAAVIPFQYTLTAITNIDQSNPVNGTKTATLQTTPNLSTGAFTPGNNDANGGNLILNFYAPGHNAANVVTNWAAGGSFTLMSADICWTNNNTFPHASQQVLQTTSASITPAVTATMLSGSDNYNCVAVALKVASAGTSKASIKAGTNNLHIEKILHMSNAVSGITTWTLQAPVVGNLRVYFDGPGDATAVSDNEGFSSANGGWVLAVGGSSGIAAWVSKRPTNQAPNPNYSLTLTYPNVPPSSGRFYDISGADPANPIDQTAINSNVNLNGASVFNDAPVITPTVIGLTLAGSTLGTGPVFVPTSPSGAVFDLCLYTGETDAGTMENADGHTHFYHTTLTTQHYNWPIHNDPANTGDSVAITIRAAPVSNPPTLMGQNML